MGPHDDISPTLSVMRDMCGSAAEPHMSRMTDSVGEMSSWGPIYRTCETQLRPDHADRSSLLPYRLTDVAGTPGGSGCEMGTASGSFRRVPLAANDLHAFFGQSGNASTSVRSLGVPALRQ